MKTFSLKQIAQHIGAEINGDPETVVSGLAPLTEATHQDLSFLDNKQYVKSLPDTKAAAVILQKEFVDKCPVASLIVGEPYVSFAKVTALFADLPAVKPGIHPTAIIGEDCDIPASVSIGPYAVIGNHVKLGEHTIIDAHCNIGDDCQIGSHSRLFSNVVVYYRSQIGNQVTIQAGVVIGADGFGFANDKGKWVRIYQLGRVLIGNRVEIGANTCIDRGAIKDTIIGDDVIIDNQVQIGHNVEIGAGTAIAGCTGIAGSTKIGRYCLIGGSVDINGHIEICDKVSLVGSTTVMRSITKPGVYSSATTEQTYQDWLRSLSIFHKLPKMAKTLSRLEELGKKYALMETNNPSEKPRFFVQKLLKYFSVKRR